VIKSEDLDHAPLVTGHQSRVTRPITKENSHREWQLAFSFLERLTCPVRPRTST
jgi:hypothetical protein